MTSTLHELVADILGLDPGDVDEGLSRETADNWDSLNHLRIVTAVEQAFSVRLTMDEIQSATSVGLLQAILERKAAKS
jgi:acyl carrier protein